MNVELILVDGLIRAAKEEAAKVLNLDSKVSFFKSDSRSLLFNYRTNFIFYYFYYYYYQCHYYY